MFCLKFILFNDSILLVFPTSCWRKKKSKSRVFSLGGMGPPIQPKFCQSSPPPPHRHLSPLLDQGLSPPAKVRPRKFDKFKYIFVSNLTSFKLKGTLKSCISCLKWQKCPNFVLGGQFELQSDFFHKSPPPPTSSPSGTDVDKKF